MTRNFAERLADALRGYAESHRYPTRSVEYMLAWMMVAWASMLALPGKMLGGVALLQVMPSWAWATIGLSIGFLRLFALIRNGSWKKSPWLRLLGASVGFNFWLSLFVLYGLASAQVFPMYGCLPVMMFFEIYSAYRCGQDARGV